MSSLQRLLPYSATEKSGKINGMLKTICFEGGGGLTNEFLQWTSMVQLQYYHWLWHAVMRELKVWIILAEYAAVTIL